MPKPKKQYLWLDELSTKEAAQAAKDGRVVIFPDGGGALMTICPFQFRSTVNCHPEGTPEGSGRVDQGPWRRSNDVRIFSQMLREYAQHDKSRHSERREESRPSRAEMLRCALQDTAADKGVS